MVPTRAVGVSFPFEFPDRDSSEREIRHILKQLSDLRDQKAVFPELVRPETGPKKGNPMMAWTLWLLLVQSAYEPLREFQLLPSR